jgi:hypothetical protein
MASQGENPGLTVYRHKVADKLVQNAASRVQSTNKVLIALLVLIIWSWLSNLLSIDLSGGIVGTPESRISDANNAWSDFVGPCKKVLKTGDGQKGVDASREECNSLFDRLIEKSQGLSNDFDLLVIKPSSIHLNSNPCWYLL